jgi:NAD(P)H-hydrate epimerase
MKSAMIEITNDSVRSLLPQRDGRGHKGTFGTALIVAGSPYMTGAGVLAAESCLRSGAGMVRYMSDEKALLPVQIKCPCALTSSIGNDMEESRASIKKYYPKASACLIGPGTDEEDDRIRTILTVLISGAKALVIDASALNIISRYKDHYLPLIASRQDKGLDPAVLTPHLGEFARLCDGVLDPGEEGALKFASEYKTVLVLKSHDTLVADTEGNCYVNKGENSGLAKGGSGDVLSGLMTGLYAQGMKAQDAAVAAVYIHAKAGLCARSQKGERAMLPSDLPDMFPEVINGIFDKG